MTKLGWRVLVLTVPHGASHIRVANALRRGLLSVRPDCDVKVADALEWCPAWFRHYYNSYIIPLKFCPALWGFIESQQHGGDATNPVWMYRRAGRLMAQRVREYDPDAVVATEVGMCEIAALLKREMNFRFSLVGAITGVDVDRAWAQPEVDLFQVSPGDAARQLIECGVPAHKISDSGQPVDLRFGYLDDPALTRRRLGVSPERPLALALFGGAGFGSPIKILKRLRSVGREFQTVFITGKNAKLENKLRRAAGDDPNVKILGWIDNMHEWMAAADFVITKPGATTLIECINSCLPILALEPLPGNERRACDWIEERGVGRWVRRESDLASHVEEFLTDKIKLLTMRERMRVMARPDASVSAARRILELVPAHAESASLAAASFA